MSKWSTRLVASAGIATAIAAFSVAASYGVAPGPSASADKDGATGTAVGVPGTLTISESTARQGQNPSWTGVSLADTLIIGKNTEGWTGTAAGLGATIDALNVALCPTPIALDASTVFSVCAALLPSYANASTEGTFDHSEAGGSLAQAGAGLITNDATVVGGGIDVLPSQAAASGPDCPLTSSMAGLLTIALANGLSPQHIPLGLELAAFDGCAAAG
jgi:hypothetical protein